MITVKKNAIKYKSSDGTMKDSGVLCQVGTFGVDYIRYAYAVQFTQDVLPPIVNFQLDEVESLQNLMTASAGGSLQELTITCKKPIKSIYRFLYSSVTKFQYLKKVIFNVDTSQCINFTNAFCYLFSTDEDGIGNVEIIGELDFSSATAMNNVFSSSSGLKEVRLKTETLSMSISFAVSKYLSSASIQSIIDGLADLTGGTAQTITFHKDIEAKLSDEQKAQITSKNWTLAFSK